MGIFAQVLVPLRVAAWVALATGLLLHTVGFTDENPHDRKPYVVLAILRTGEGVNTRGGSTLCTSLRLHDGGALRSDHAREITCCARDNEVQR